MRSILKLLALVTCIDNGVWTRGAHSHEYGFRVFLPQEVLPEAEAGVVFHKQPTILAVPMEAIPKELSTCGFLSTAGSLPTCCQDVDGLGRRGKAKTWRGSGVRKVSRSLRSVRSMRSVRSGDVRIVHSKRTPSFDRSFAGQESKSECLLPETLSTTRHGPVQVLVPEGVWRPTPNAYCGALFQYPAVKTTLSTHEGISHLHQVAMVLFPFIVCLFVCIVQRSAVVYVAVRAKVCKKFILMVPAEQRNALFIYDKAQTCIAKGGLVRMRIMFRQIKKAVRGLARSGFHH